jgi:hypothetical protein
VLRYGLRVENENCACAEFISAYNQAVASVNWMAAPQVEQQGNEKYCSLGMVSSSLVFLQVTKVNMIGQIGKSFSSLARNSTNVDAVSWKFMKLRLFGWIFIDLHDARANWGLDQ